MKKFRNLRNNLAVKILLGLIALSFVTFGIDNFIMGISVQNVVEVGDSSISLRQFIDTLNHKRYLISRYSDEQEDLSYLSSEKFRKEVLNEMINEALLINAITSLGLSVNEDLALKNITSNPLFFDQNNVFNPNVYHTLLAQNNISEKSFITQTQKDIAKALVLSSLTLTQPISQIQIEQLHQYRGEKRTVDIITIGEQKKLITTPPENELKIFFEEKKEKFITPETRSVSYITINPDSVIKDVQVSDEEVQENYETNIDQYKQFERRDVYNLVFNSKKKAQSAYQMLNQGEDIEEVTYKLFNKTAGEMLLVGVTKPNLIPEVGEAAFALEKDTHSNIIQSPMGFHVFYVAEIYPESATPLEEVEESIRENLLIEKQETTLREFVDAIDYELLISESLDEVAQKFDLTLKNTSVFDLKGIDLATGKSIAETAELENFSAIAFELEMGEFSPILSNRDRNKHFILTLNKISPPHEKTFEEAKNEVLKLYQAHRYDEQLQELANDIIAKISVGDHKQIVTDNENIQVTENVELSRLSNENISLYAPEMIQEVFTKNVNQITGVYKGTQQKYQFAIITDIIPVESDLEDEERQKIGDALSNMLIGDIIFEYHQYLKMVYPVKIKDKKVALVQ